MVHTVVVFIERGFFFIEKKTHAEKHSHHRIKEFRARLDNCVVNESLETLFWLKLGFVIMIIGYIYIQKCNENAKKKRLIYFEL